MCFTRDFISILKDQNDALYKIDSQNGLNISKYDVKGEIIYRKRICTGNYTFIDYWFDIDNDNTIYGLINDKKSALIYVQIKGNIIVKKQLLNYNTSQKFLKYVLIKKTINSISLAYYCADMTSPLKYNLIHYYKNITGWHKSIIDSVENTALTNYILLYDKTGNMNVLYLKLDNKFEELFISSFNTESLSWTTPIQITNSHKSKIYLSAIIDKNNRFHILFSEKSLFKYECTYICGYIKNNLFTISHYNILGNCTACSFPSIIEHNSRISALWVEYNNLNMCSSNNFGNTWSPVLINPQSCTVPFTCCNYKSSLSSENSLNYYSVFMNTNCFRILGLDK